MTSTKPPDWEAIRAAYCARDLTIEEICLLHNVHRTTLSRRARKEAWPPRRSGTGYDRSRRAGTNRPDVPDASGEPIRAGMRSKLIAQIYRVLEDQVQHMEATSKRGRQETAPGDYSSAALEKEARTLNALVRILEKLGELEAKSPTERDDTKNSGEDNTIENADQLREALARRLERLRKQRGL